MLSRRDMLTLLLGAPAAAFACRRAPTRAYDGRIVGGSLNLGHRLLHPDERQSVHDTRDVEIAIVGSGIAGLSAAWRFERRGESRFCVLELESKAGGTACYGDDAFVPYPWAAHYIPVPEPSNHDLRSLLEEVGALERYQTGVLRATDGALVRAPDERLFIDGQWISGLVPRVRMQPADWEEFRRFQRHVDAWVAYRDDKGRRAFALPLKESSPDSPFVADDAISALAWLRRENFRSKWLYWWLDYGCRDDYGCTLQSTSAWALMFYHAARIPAPGAASAPFLTWSDGNGHVVRYLESVVGPRLKRGQLVTRVEQKDAQVELTVLGANGEAPFRLRAHHVVLAVPEFIRRHLLSTTTADATRADASRADASFTYAPWLVANLHLKDRPRSRGFPLAWDNVLFDSPSLGYVVATHQTLEDDGPTILTYYFPLTDAIPAEARRELAHREHAACCDVVVSDLVRAHPDLPNLISRIDIWRWGHAMIRPIPGLIWGSKLAEASAPRGRIHFAHTDLSGLALFEEAHAHGVRAADEILKQRGAVPVVG